MGKSKKRIIYKGKNDHFKSITREDAVKSAVQLLNCGDKEAYSTITLFGLTAEELLEAGASFEVIKGLGNIVKLRFGFGSKIQDFFLCRCQFCLG